MKAAVLPDIPRAQWAMLSALGALLLVCQIDQPFPQTAWLHHFPTLIALLAAPLALRRWQVSNGALACLIVFLALHTIGGRYTYSAVPYDQLARALTGTSFSEAFGWSRNHYDRLVHLSYGLLTILPVREALERHFGLSRRVSLYIAFESVLAVSAVYEIFEWLLTLAAAGPTAAAYNGQQGDIWDAQKDMLLAAAGAAIALVVLRWRRSGAIA
jgi:putative membrane protein